MLFTASNIHKSSHGCVYFLSPPAWGAQGKAGQLVAGLPVLGHHECPPPSMQPTPPHQSPSFETVFNQVHSRGRRRNKLFNSQGSKASPERFKSKADRRKPPRQFFRRHLCSIHTAERAPGSSALCHHRPQRAPSTHLPRPPPQGSRPGESLTYPLPTSPSLATVTRHDRTLVLPSFPDSPCSRRR